MLLIYSKTRQMSTFWFFKNINVKSLSVFFLKTSDKTEFNLFFFFSAKERVFWLQ